MRGCFLCRRPGRRLVRGAQRMYHPPRKLESLQLGRHHIRRIYEEVFVGPSAARSLYIGCVCAGCRCAARGEDGGNEVHEPADVAEVHANLSTGRRPDERCGGHPDQDDVGLHDSLALAYREGTALHRVGQGQSRDERSWRGSCRFRRFCLPHREKNPPVHLHRQLRFLRRYRWSL